MEPLKKPILAADFQVLIFYPWDKNHHLEGSYLGIRNNGWKLVFSPTQNLTENTPQISFFFFIGTAAEALLSGSTLVEVVGRATVGGWAGGR